MTQDMNQRDENRDQLPDTKPSGESYSRIEPQLDNRTVPDQPDTGSQLLWIESGVIDELRSRWNSIQAQFVDQPCTAIEQADALIADALERIQKSLAEQQAVLRDRWYDHEDISTEELRVTLQDYRSYLNSLLDHH